MTLLSRYQAFARRLVWLCGVLLLLFGAGGGCLLPTTICDDQRPCRVGWLCEGGACTCEREGWEVSSKCCCEVKPGEDALCCDGLCVPAGQSGLCQ